MSICAPKISIIIPARNASTYIVDTITSVRQQSEAAFEAIILDDGSTDDTDLVVQRLLSDWADPRFSFSAGPAAGVSAARNAGLARARGAFVLFLDADDVLAADALARFRTALNISGSDTVAALGRILRVTEKGEPMPSQNNLGLLPVTGQLEALLKKNYIVNGGALAIRVDAARASGGYDESLRYGEDWEFWCRLLLKGGIAPVQGGPVLHYRQVAEGANYRARGSALARDVPCLNAVAKNAEIRAQVGGGLTRLLRARRIDIFWSGVRATYQFGSKFRALATAALGVLLYPDSMARPGLAMRFLRTLRR
jgi:GT2 family glycosyltransferase